MIYYEDVMWANILLPYIQGNFNSTDTTPISSLAGVNLKDGDVVIGFNEKQSKNPGITIVSYYTEGSVLGVVNTIINGASANWVLDELKTTFVEGGSSLAVLPALYRAFGTRVYEHLHYFDKEQTVSENNDIIIKYGEDAVKQAIKLNKMPVVDNKYRIIREDPLNFMTTSRDKRYTFVEIQNRPNHVVLHVMGERKVEVLEKFKEFTTYNNITGGYIIMPDGILDLSTTIIENVLKG